MVIFLLIALGLGLLGLTLVGAVLGLVFRAAFFLIALPFRLLFLAIGLPITIVGGLLTVVGLVVGGALLLSAGVVIAALSSVLFPLAVVAFLIWIVMRATRRPAAV